jgi:hypothetical protein
MVEALKLAPIGGSGLEHTHFFAEWGLKLIFSAKAIVKSRVKA